MFLDQTNREYYILRNVQSGALATHSGWPIAHATIEGIRLTRESECGEYRIEKWRVTHEKLGEVE